MSCAMCARGVLTVLCWWDGRQVLLCFRCRRQIRAAIAVYITDLQRRMKSETYPVRQAPRRRHA